MSWLLTRSAGVGAYLMLYLAVAWGLLATTSLVTKRVSKRSSTAFHGFVASAGLALLALHLIGLLLDRFVRFDLLDLLVPFRATYRPFALALGIVAMFATVIVLATSWTRKLLRPALWRAIHLLAVPAYAMALLHGLLAGSDSARPGMAILYWVSGLSVLFLVMVRGLTARPPRVRRTAGEGSAVTSVGRRSGGRALGTGEHVRDATESARPRERLHPPRDEVDPPTTSVGTERMRLDRRSVGSSVSGFGSCGPSGDELG